MCFVFSLGNSLKNGNVMWPKNTSSAPEILFKKATLMTLLLQISHESKEAYPLFANKTKKNPTKK